MTLPADRPRPRTQRTSTESRAALRPDAERAEALFSTGDKVAGDAYSAETLGRTLSRRVAELADDPTTPLFFGRLDFGATARATHAGHRYHIGRRHVTDDAGEPMVLDWRAPVSRPFYQASARDPQGVARPAPVRLPAPATLTSFEDEHLDRGEELGTGQPDPDRRDRAAARRADARHRRHHPARAGRAGPRRPRRLHLRAGRARHRQDRRRPAPRRVPALPAPRAAAPVRRARRRAQPGLPVATSPRCCRRSARSRSSSPRWTT